MTVQTVNTLPKKFDATSGSAIDNEAWREYIYPNGDVLRVVGAIRLFVDKKDDGNDGHRLIVKDVGRPGEIGMYIKRGWLGIRWQGRDGGHGITF